MHQPPSGSPYSRDFANDPDWQALRARAQALSGKRKVFVYGFGLGSRTDISLLLKIFPATSVEVLVGDAAQVAAAVGRIRESLRSAQLRMAVEQDLSAGCIEVRFAQSAVSSGASRIENQITILNGYRYLPVIIESVSLQTTGESSREIVCEIENFKGALPIGPGQTWNGKFKASLRSAPSNLRLGRVEHVYRAGVQTIPVARFEHAAEIAMLNGGEAAPLCDSPPLRIELRAHDGVPYWSIVSPTIAGLGLALIIRRKRNHIARHRTSVEQRHAERRRFAGMLKIWPSHKDEPDGQGMDLNAYKAMRLDLVLNTDGSIEIALPGPNAATVVAHLSGHLIGATPGKAESGKVEFRVESARNHRLAYESAGVWRETTRVVLCDRDLIEIDGIWRLRYANHRLRMREEIESASYNGVRMERP